MWLHQRKCFSPPAGFPKILLPADRRRSSLSPTGDQAIPFSNRQGIDYRHNEENELISLSTKYNPGLGRQFQISTRQTLCELYWVQGILSSEKIGMNTSEIFTLLIKYSLPKAYGKWQEKKKQQKNLKIKPDILSE